MRTTDAPIPAPASLSMQPSTPLGTPDAAPADPSAWAALARQLRATTDTVLVACALTGLLGFAALGVLGVEKAAWFAPLIATGAAGVWGITDRELRERRERDARGDGRGRGEAARRALQLARASAVAIGAAAALLSAGAVVAALLGTVIS